MTKQQMTFREWVDDGMHGTFIITYDSEFGNEYGHAASSADEDGNQIIEIVLPGILGRYKTADEAADALSVVRFSLGTGGYVDGGEDSSSGEQPAAEKPEEDS